jgi:putative ABC transport system permease protein
VLVIGEVALSIVLLVGAGLLLKSFLRLQSIDPGFRSEKLLTLRLALPLTRYKTTEMLTRFHDRLLPRVAALPGVTSVGSTEILPLSGLSASSSFIIVGRPPASDKGKPVAHYRAIDSGYFHTMGIPILRGRDISEADTSKTASVAIVSEALARQYWPDENPVGQHVKLDDSAGPARELEVIGVSGDIRAMELDQDPTPIMFIALAQAPQDAVRFIANNLFWVVKTSTEPMSLANTVRREIHAVDGDVAAASTLTMEQYMERSVNARRFSLEILGIFAAAALLLAATGLYALLSHSAAHRTREIGVRMALGARPSDVLRLIVGQGLSLAALGVVIGGAGALTLSSIITAMLFNVAPRDPVTLIGVSVMLLAVAAGASYVPARRALRVDPVTALRSE